MIIWVDPGTTEDINRSGVNIVVNHSGIYRKQSHEKNNVATSEEGVEDFVSDLGSLNFLLENNKEKGRKEHDNSVSCITEHECEDEGESDDCPRSRIDFSVIGNTVRIHNVLEPLSELVDSVEGWGCFRSFQLMKDCRNSGSRFLSGDSEGMLNFRNICSRDPAFSNQTLLGDIHVEVVQNVENGLELQHTDFPFSLLQSSSIQDDFSVSQGLADYSRHVFQLSVDTDSHLCSLGFCFRDVDNSGSEGITYFGYLAFQLVSGHEEHENGFLLFVREESVVVGKFIGSDVDFSSRQSPQNSFESSNFVSLDGSCNEFQLGFSLDVILGFHSIWTQLEIRVEMLLLAN